MFQATRNIARKYGAKAAAFSATALASVGAFAQTTGDNPIVELLGGVQLAGVAAAVLALAAIIVTITLTMKGPDVAKRIIRKV